MEILKNSGNSFAISEDEFRLMVECGHTITDVKRFLAERVGYSRFQQRLCDRFAQFPDDIPVRL